MGMEIIALGAIGYYLFFTGKKKTPTLAETGAKRVEGSFVSQGMQKPMPIATPYDPNANVIQGTAPSANTMGSPQTVVLPARPPIIDGNAPDTSVNLHSWTQEAITGLREDIATGRVSGFVAAMQEASARLTANGITHNPNDPAILDKAGVSYVPVIEWRAGLPYASHVFDYVMAARQKLVTVDQLKRAGHWQAISSHYSSYFK